MSEGVENRTNFFKTNDLLGSAEDATLNIDNIAWKEEFVKPHNLSMKR